MKKYACNHICTHTYAHMQARTHTSQVYHCFEHDYGLATFFLPSHFQAKCTTLQEKVAIFIHHHKSPNMLKP